jgi:hypothetical protein
MIVGKAIYHLLTNATAITDIVGTRIYPEVAQQDGDLPYIVYNVSNNEPSDTKPEPSKLDTAEIEVHCYATSYSQAIDIAVAVRGALDRVKGTYNGVNVQSIQYINEVIDFDEPQRAYEVTADYEVRISRTDFEIAQGSPITGVELGQLSDVNVTGVTDNQILSYDAASDTWVPAADAGGAEVLNDLTDVDASQPEDNQMLAYQQGEWTTIHQDEIVLPIASVTGLQAELNTIPDGLDDLDDVKIIGTPAEGDALVYQSGFWSRGTAGASTLGDLDDVNTTGAGFGSTIVYNGSTWEISGSALPSDDIYYHNRYLTEAGTLRSGATETVELYYTAQADGDGLSESASSDTPTSGYDIRRKLWYAEKAQADPDTSADWTQFTAIADNTTFANAKAALLAYLKERTGGTVPISLKMTWEEVSQTAYLLDQSYGSGAEAAYSTRQLRNAATDCMVIRRASDLTTTTIGFDGSGNIDESAIETFCTGTTCTVVTWKDQSGNGNDATALSTGEEPTIYTGGALVKEGGKVALDFDGTDDYFDLTGLTVSPSDYSVFITNQNSRTTLSWLFDSQSGRIIFDGRGSSGVYTDPINGWQGTEHSGTGQMLQTIMAISPSSGQSYINSTQVNSGLNYSQTPIGGTVTLGSGYPNRIRRIQGNFQEFVLYASDKSSVRTDIESNIGDYFTQNTPLLDTYSGAAAAYSLRLLDSTYTGALINVWNGTSYADIYPNVFGELDTVALATHCGSNDGFIRYWYDQSGNTNTATQTATGQMPKIYDGTTGVVTENGKPAVDFDGFNDVLTATVSISNTEITSNFVVMRSDVVTGIRRILDHTSGSDARNMSFVNSQFNIYDGANGLTTGTAATATQYLMEGYYKTNDAEIYVNNASVGTLGTFNQTTVSNVQIAFSSGNALNGIIQELIIWTTDQRVSNRSTIASNINTFYNIY